VSKACVADFSENLCLVQYMLCMGGGEVEFWNRRNI